LAVAAEGLSAERTRETRAAIEEAVRRSRVPLWQRLAGAGLLAALIVAGIFFFLPTSTVTVLLQLDVDVNDPNLSFLLDEQAITAEQLRVPVALKVGDHQLEVRRGGAVWRRYRFRVDRRGRAELKLEPAGEGPPPAARRPPPAGGGPQVKQRPPAAPAVPATPRVRLLVPAYFYPGGAGLKDWQRLFRATEAVEIIAVANVDSGPGKARKPDYTAVVSGAVKAKVTLIGYVSTDRGNRPPADVKADVDRWFQFYPELQGIFFDEQAPDVEHVDYYLDVCGYARQKRPGARIVTNPGGDCDKEYVTRAVADVVCLTERDHEIGIRLPAWAKRERPDRFAALVYQIKKPAQMQQVVREMVAKGFGYLFVTDGTQPNPWDHLPPWWEEEWAAVRALDQAKVR
jgi:hypothetical protein